MNSDITPLISLLAEVDAIHTPVRRYVHGPRHAALEQRLDFGTVGGLPWSVGGADVDRKAAERRAATWEAGGLAVFGRCRGKRTTWRLSDQGDWQMRARAGLYGYEEMHVCLLALEVHQAAGYTNDRGGVPEVALSGTQWDGRDASELLDLEETLLPALARGYATSNADCHGRVSYRLTSSGQKWLKAPPPPPTGLPEYDPAIGRRYVDFFLAALRRLERTLPNKPAIWIPHSAGTYPDGEPTAAPPVLMCDGRPRSLADFLRRLRTIQGRQNTAAPTSGRR